VIPLRFDIIFYFFGIICFVLAVCIIPFWGVTLIPVAFLIVLLLFGLFFIASGYSARPKKYPLIVPAKPTETKVEEKPIQPPPTPSKPLTELNKIKGIGPKRIAQLKALQITSVEDLARFSAEDLATELKISSKITAKWIEQARNLMKEAS
jgi:predicted flap endonuclease-1-like 5' DNA nuclease